MKHEQYRQSAIEDTRAQAMMTEGQKRASENRAENAFQEIDPFAYFLEQIDNNEERRPATDAEKERMDASLVKLGQLFKDSGIRWHLDGAMNISLMKGEYIGVHKDVDVSVAEEDLLMLDIQFARNGYGFFLNHPVDSAKNGATIMERVTAEKFAETDIENLSILAVDQSGKIRDDEALTAIDVHLVRHGRGGGQLHSGIELPAKWQQTEICMFKGQEIRLCHPAEIAYFKLHNDRAYDQNDLRVLAETGRLSLKDVEDIEELFAQEEAVRQKKVMAILNRIGEQLTQEMDGEEIFQLFLRESSIDQANDKVINLLKQLVGKIMASDRSAESVVRLAFEVFNIRSATAEKIDKLADLKKWVGEAAQ